MRSTTTGPSAATALRTAGAAVLGIGVATALWATFLPWLTSGSVPRDLFQAAGVLRTFPLTDNPAVPIALAALPYLGFALMAPCLLVALRAWRSGAAAAVAIGSICAIGAGTVLALLAGKSRLGVHLATEGPLTLLTGALLVLASGGLVAGSARAASGAGAKTARDGRPPTSGGKADNNVVTVGPEGSPGGTRRRPTAS